MGNEGKREGNKRERGKDREGKGKEERSHTSFLNVNHCIIQLNANA